VSNFYIVDLENFATASRRYTGDIHNSTNDLLKYADDTYLIIPAVEIAVATLSGNSLRQTVHTHRASVHQAAKLVAALLRVAGVTAGLAESNGSLLTT